MEALIIGLIGDLAPLAIQAITASKDTHDDIVKKFNEKVIEAYAQANGLSAALDASDEKFHEELRNLAERMAEPTKP